MNKMLQDIMRRADGWPEAAQRELADLAREIEADLGQGIYTATTEELAGIDRGLRGVAEGRFAGKDEVAALLGKLRS